MMADYNAKCDDCGRFMNCEASGSSTARKYDLVAMECIYDHWRCPSCTSRLGPVHSNARPNNGNMTPYESYVD